LGDRPGFSPDALLVEARNRLASQAKGPAILACEAIDERIEYIPKNAQIMTR
jgi:hypothetical protein